MPQSWWLFFESQLPLGNWARTQVLIHSIQIQQQFNMEIPGYYDKYSKEIKPFLKVSKCQYDINIQVAHQL